MNYLVLQNQINCCLLKDKPRLWHEFKQWRAHADSCSLQRLQQAIQQSQAQVSKRLAQRPVIDFPIELPITEQLTKIKEVLFENQVVVIAGETGSGKTTQIPKICLAIGRGIQGMIGHTQPRRIAARTVASRIAEELQTELGQAVGYQVRFSDQVSEGTYIKLMTDGILLAEIQQDCWLNAYDTIILDEAHERSINIDLLLGYLKQLLPKRPELKLIITSATINPKQFSDYFDRAPIIEVPGRSYPIIVHYRPPEDKQDLNMAIIDCLREIKEQGSGDVLIFLNGERAIRDLAIELRKLQWPQTEILPLYARLSIKEQQRVFTPHSRRRIVLATNVAETSLTVPNIRFVIDTGLARISRYSHRTKVQRLPIEPIAQANAEQRKGRCGRTASGICYRLYSELDFQQRPLFTDAEIKRTNLASVILQLAMLRIGKIETFPFIEQPDPRYIRDAYRTLEELAALDAQGQLTAIGRQLGRLPLDPRLGRMLLAAQQEHCLREMLVIVSALSIQDPREYPLEQYTTAVEKHRRWHHLESDFLSYLQLWQHLQEQKEKMTRQQLRKYCSQQFIAYQRFIEWRDLYRQLHTLVTEELGFRLNEAPAEYANIHCALVSGLLSRLAQKKETNHYIGARGIKLRLHPSSGLRKKQPAWIVAAEWVETQHFYASIVARIEPEWLEKLGAHLLKYSYADPVWEARTGRVMANERVSLYGLVIIPQRRVHYGPQDPQLAREIFIREALVHGRWQTKLPFLQHNQRLLQKLQQWEEKARRRDIVLTEDALVDYYHRYVPEGIYTGKQFETWYIQAAQQPKLLWLTEEQLLQLDLTAFSLADYPGHITYHGVDYRLTYSFAPGDEKDGVTLHIPLAHLNRLSPEPFTWLVPGYLIEKIKLLLKGLPKPIRRLLVPLPEVATQCSQILVKKERTQSLSQAIADYLKETWKIQLALSDLAETQLPPYLRMRFRVYDEKGSTLAISRDLLELQHQLGNKSHAIWKSLPAHPIERSGITQWDFGDLPQTVLVQQGEQSLTAYVGFIDKQDSIAIGLFSTASEARQHSLKGVLRLFHLQLRQEITYLHKNLLPLKPVKLLYACLGSERELHADCIQAALSALFNLEASSMRSQHSFQQVLKRERKKLIPKTMEIAGLTAQILLHWQSCKQQLQRLDARLPDEIMRDIAEQLDHFVYPHFVAQTPLKWLNRYPAYFKALQLRLERAEQNPTKDLALLKEITPFWQAYWQTTDKQREEIAWQEFRWYLEEYRIALFAQPMKPLMPISKKKITQHWNTLPR